MRFVISKYKMEETKRRRKKEGRRRGRRRSGEIILKIGNLCITIQTIVV